MFRWGQKFKEKKEGIVSIVNKTVTKLSLSLTDNGKKMHWVKSDMKKMRKPVQKIHIRTID